MKTEHARIIAGGAKIEAGRYAVQVTVNPVDKTRTKAFSLFFECRKVAEGWRIEGNGQCDVLPTKRRAYDRAEEWAHTQFCILDATTDGTEP